MVQLSLHAFIDIHKDDLIRRCRLKVSQRTSPEPTPQEVDHGVPLFLDQLLRELALGPSLTREIAQGALLHGEDLMRQGYTVSQVVHDYGDVCQSITDLAVELEAPIRTEDFRTLNRCLDDAIAVAVTQFANAQDSSKDERTRALRTLVRTALSAFEALQTGNVGIGGSTAAALERSLLGMLPLLASPEDALPVPPAAIAP